MANPPTFTPSQPYFFKIIFEGTLLHRKLKLPRKFVKKYGNVLLTSPEVELIVPDGATWPVGVTVTESDGNVWFQNGWHDFAEYYSLQPYHILFFKYEGRVTFRVSILDGSALEIEYPCRAKKCGKQKAVEVIELDSDKEEANGVENPCRVSQAKGKRAVEVVEESGEEETNDDESCSDESYKEEADDESSSDESWCREIPSSSKSRRQKQQSPYSPPPKMMRTTSTNKDKTGPFEGATAIERANLFKSQNPFFVVEMQPSYIIDPVRNKPGRKMVLPLKFMKQHLNEKSGHMKLSTADGKTWSVECWHYKTSNKYARAVIHKGWSEFMLDNELAPGDVCVFELINQTETKFKVIIYRATHDCNDHQSSFDGPLASHKKAVALERATSFKSTKPFFKVVIQPKYLTHAVCIPYKFSKAYLDGKEQVKLQVSDGRRWILKHRVYDTASKQRKASLYYNWSAFVQNNKLKTGDGCIFELINRAESSFNVHIL